MVSYEKIIKGFLKNPLVFKWELFKDVCASINSSCYKNKKNIKIKNKNNKNK